MTVMEIETRHEKWIGTSQQTLTTEEHPAIDSASNRFTSGQRFTFDPNGNVVIDAQGRQFTFNGDNKQTKVRDDQNNVIGEYFYDGEGKRIKKVVGVDTTIFVYSGSKLIAEYSTATPPTNPTTRFTITDQLGSPRVIVDSLGQVVSRRDFLPFGEEIEPDGTYRTTAQKYGQVDHVRQKFTGYQSDEETGLDFAEARMYQNLHGRFTAVDPLLASGKSPNPQTFNRYVYVINNPLILVDPSGLQAGSKDDLVPCKGPDCSVSVDRRTNPPTVSGRSGPLIDLVVGPDNGEGDNGLATRVGANLTNDAIKNLLGGFSQRIDEIQDGSSTGAANAAINLMNGAINASFHAQGIYYGVPQIPRFEYTSLAGARFGTAIEGVALVAPAIFGGVFSASGTASLSVVPSRSSTAFPPIKIGSSGGSTAGSRYISVDVRRQAAAENPYNYCVYCRQQTSNIQFEHAVPLSRGGNSTIENIQRACPFCNQSKGARDFPVNPAPGYEGPFPPPWWKR